MGRPSELTPEIAARLLALIRAGHKRKSACGLAHVNYDTFKSWLTQAKEQPDSYFSHFSNQLEEAEAERNGTLVENWLVSTKTDWRATAKYLAIVDPDEYSEQRQIRVTHDGQVNHIHVAVQAINLAEVASLLQLPGANVIDLDPNDP